MRTECTSRHTAGHKGVAGHFQFVGINAHEMIDRSMHIGHVMGGFHGMVTQFVSRPLDHTPSDTGTGHPDTETE